MVYDKDEIINDKLISVYGALHNLGSRIAAIVRSIGGEIEFYIATFSESSGNTSGLLMQSALKNNFPGIKMDSALASSEAQSLLESIISNASVPGSIASVSLRPLLARILPPFFLRNQFPEKLFHVGNLDLKNLHPNFLRMAK